MTFSIFYTNINKINTDFLLYILHRRLDRANVAEDFRKMVRSEILCDINGRESYLAKSSVMWKTWRRIMANMAAKYNERTNASSLSDDEKRVVRQLRVGMSEWRDKPAVIKSLEKKVALYDLEEFHKKARKGEKLEEWEINRTNKLAQYHSQDVSRVANQLLSSIGAPMIMR